MDGLDPLLRVFDGLYLGGDNTSAGGTGELIIESGGNVVMESGPLIVWGAEDTITLVGGMLRTGHFDNSNGGTFNFDSGSFNMTSGVFTEGIDGYDLSSVQPSGKHLSLGGTSVWTNAGNLNVGVAGTGSFRLENTARLNLGDGASAFNATAQMVISDRDSGGSHGGHLRIGSGGIVQNFDTTIIGAFNNEFGYVTVSGSDAFWQNSAYAYVGDSGTGEIRITDGATARHDGLVLGNNPESQGRVTVSGNGTVHNIVEAFIVGHSGVGSYVVQEGAEARGFSGGRDLRVGVGAQAVGTVKATGVGSAFDLGDLSIGEHGTGSLTIEAGGAMKSGPSSIGLESGGSGTVTVIDPGTIWESTSSVSVGRDGAGALAVSNGATLAVRVGVGIGSGTGAGQILVTGAGSSIETEFGWMVVGNHGTATLAVEDGGSVSAEKGMIGFESGSTGFATVRGQGSIWTSRTELYIGGSDSGAGGNGTLNVIDAGVVEAVDLTLWRRGVVNLAGGTLKATNINHTDGGTFHFSGGELIVDTFQGSLNQFGGALAPGNSPGLTAISGDYGMEGGTLAIEIGGTIPGAEHDRVEVAGYAELQGELDVKLTDGFVPSSGDSFGFLFAGGGFNASFSNLVLPDLLPSGLGWQLNPGGSTLFLDVIALTPGDTDGDGDIDDVDLGTSFSHYTGALGAGVGGKAFAEGDTDGDGDVDDADLGTSFAGYTGALGPSHVPEPASVVVLALAGGLLTRRRRIA